MEKQVIEIFVLSFWREGLFFASFLSLFFSVAILMHYKIRDALVLTVLYFVGSYVVVQGLLVSVDGSSEVMKYFSFIPVDLELLDIISVAFAYLAVACLFYGAMLVAAKKLSRRRE